MFKANRKMDIILENIGIRFPSEHHVPPSYQPVLPNSSTDLDVQIDSSSQLNSFIESRVQDRGTSCSESRPSIRVEICQTPPDFKNLIVNIDNFKLYFEQLFKKLIPVHFQNLTIPEIKIHSACKSSYDRLEGNNKD